MSKIILKELETQASDMRIPGVEMLSEMCSTFVLINYKQKLFSLQISMHSCG
jgi:hypothetical protein